MSNFVYPSWFEPFEHPRGTKFDHMGSLKAPFSMTEGGYVIKKVERQEGDQAVRLTRETAALQRRGPARPSQRISRSARRASPGPARSQAARVGTRGVSGRVRTRRPVALRSALGLLFRLGCLLRRLPGGLLCSFLGRFLRRLLCSLLRSFLRSLFGCLLGRLLGFLLGSLLRRYFLRDLLGGFPDLLTAVTAASLVASTAVVIVSIACSVIGFSSSISSPTVCMER